MNKYYIVTQRYIVPGEQLAQFTDGVDGVATVDFLGNFASLKDAEGATHPGREDHQFPTPQAIYDELKALLVSGYSGIYRFLWNDERLIVYVWGMEGNEGCAIFCDEQRDVVINEVDGAELFGKPRVIKWRVADSARQQASNVMVAVDQLLDDFVQTITIDGFVKALVETARADGYGANADSRTKEICLWWKQKRCLIFPRVNQGKLNLIVNGGTTEGVDVSVHRCNVENKSGETEVELANRVMQMVNDMYDRFGKNVS